MRLRTRCLKYFFRPAIVAGHFAILRSWRLPLLRRGIISLSLLSPAHSYDYYFKLDAYTPVSFVLDALDTTVVFKIERRDRFWSGARIPSKSTKQRHMHTAKSYRLYCWLCLRAYLRDKRQLKPKKWNTNGLSRPQFPGVKYYAHRLQSAGR